MLQWTALAPRSEAAAGSSSFPHSIIPYRNQISKTSSPPSTSCRPPPPRNRICAHQPQAWLTLRGLEAAEDLRGPVPLRRGRQAGEAASTAHPAPRLTRIQNSAAGGSSGYCCGQTGHQTYQKGLTYFVALETIRIFN